LIEKEVVGVFFERSDDVWKVEKHGVFLERILAREDL